MERDRERDFERGSPVRTGVIADAAGRLRDILGISREHLLLNTGELGDRARASLLQRETGAKELGVELQELRARGAAIDRLAPDARYKEREKAVVEILARSFSEAAYLDVSDGRAKKWEHLVPDEKKQILRLAEVRVAICEGVVPCKVQSYLAPRKEGSFYRFLNTMRFHEERILGNASERKAMQVLVHEQTHRTQWEAAKEPRNYPYFQKELIEIWRHNFEHYTEPGESKLEHWAYRMQPIEHDAEARSKRIVGEVYDYRKRQH
jgi:hypothetical protein